MTLHNQQRWPVHAEDEITAATNVLLSGRTNYWTGTCGREFEKEYALAVGTEYAIALMNGTVALEAALYALDIGAGDEVITTCRTFIASASCIVMRGATPVLADVDLETQNITPETIAACITPKTKAIIVVHLAGWPADMEAIMALAKRHHLKVIEDCAQAHGAAINGRQIGSWGDVAAFSFCQDKIITTGGEGGMVTTNDHSIWQKIWSFKDHGKNYDKVYHQQHPPGFRWLHDSFGTNWRMIEMQAAIGSLQLQKLTGWLDWRKQNADYFNAKFKDHPALRVTLPPKHIVHAYYKYYVFVRPEQLKQDWSRDRILNELNAEGIHSFSGSCSDIYLEKAFQNSNIGISQSNPNAKLLGDTSLMLLVDPTITAQIRQKTADALLAILDVALLEVACNA
jgi:dTDP-4-amino-4,6-dideoxygalactose transaminase